MTSRSRQKRRHGTLLSTPLADRPLASAFLKLRRAHEHLKFIEQEVVAFTELNPYRVVVEIDAEDQAQVLRVKADRKIPLEWGVLLGDFLHNVRSALDNSVWDLALRETPTPPQNTAFPICFTRSDFDGEAGKRLTGVSDRARTVIERCQPYARGNSNLADHPNPIDEPIWLLRMLSNDDKHKVINLAAMSYGGGYSFEGGERIPIRRLALIYGGIAEDGTEVGRVRGLEPKVKVHDNPAFQVCFGESTPAAGHYVVRRESYGFALPEAIFRRVEGILSRFEREIALGRI